MRKYYLKVEGFQIDELEYDDLIDDDSRRFDVLVGGGCDGSTEPGPHLNELRPREPFDHHRELRLDDSFDVNLEVVRLSNGFARINDSEMKQEREMDLS